MQEWNSNWSEGFKLQTNVGLWPIFCCLFNYMGKVLNLGLHL